ncbi:MAG: hypothetical protein HQL77_04740 [Magnetococcales bacterium]|nr:hypothetical protein [Magnetococcales bacterium]
MKREKFTNMIESTDGKSVRGRFLLAFKFLYKKYVSWNSTINGRRKMHITPLYELEKERKINKIVSIILVFPLIAAVATTAWLLTSAP